MPESIAFTLNGNPLTISTEASRTLLDVLREDLHLSGTKYGCGEAQCGSCSVLVDGKRVFSCRAAVQSVAGKKVTTIEGLATLLPDDTPDKLHPVQQAFLDEGAYQCGYCIPGMIVNTVAMLSENPKPSESEILTAMHKNICRCCGYPRILAAIKRAASSA
jgi:aerobic-type carbon monoxide dehydrogenase small subunit (CoxS/CutS family)